MSEIAKKVTSIIVDKLGVEEAEVTREASFAIADSLQLVALYNIETADNTPSDMDGGSLQKYILLVPKKTGTTKFKLYSFLEQPPTAEDSTRFTEYSINIQN